MPQPGSIASPVRPLNMLIPVWGERYIAALTDLALPFLLSPGNLPGLAHRELFTLRLITVPEEAAYLDGHPIIQRARQWVRVDVVVFPESFPRHMSHLPLFSQAYAWEIERARSRHEDVICLCADSVVSDGGLAAIERVRATGSRCIYICGHRVNQTELADWAAKHRLGDGSIQVPTRDLVRFSMEASHEWTRRVSFGDGIVQEVPGFFWMDRRANLLATSLLLHPLYIDTRAIPEDFARKSETSIDGDVPSWLDCDPADVHVFDDSDEFFAFEFSDRVALPNRTPLSGNADAWLDAWVDSVWTYIEKHLLRRPGLDAYLHNLGAKIRYHSGGIGEIDPQVEALSDRFIETMRLRVRRRIDRHMDGPVS